MSTFSHSHSGGHAIRKVVAAAGLLGAMGVVGAAHAANLDVPSDGAGSRLTVSVKSMKQTLFEMRFRSTVPQQFDFSCGAAALATLLTFHYGQPMAEPAIISAMFGRGDQAKIVKEGFSMLDMKLFLEGLGYEADGFEIGPDQFDQLLGENVPFIALIKDGGYRHFVVVKGANGKAILLGDPAKGARIVPRPEFDKLWEERIAFVIHSHQDVAQFNVPAQWRVVPQVALGNLMTMYDSLSNTMLMRPGRNDY
jgi:predicted double-glycine peptidase